MGIGQVDKKKTDPLEVTGTACSGKVFPVYLYRKRIESCNGLRKFKSGLQSFSSVPCKKKSGNPNPERDKIKVDVYPAGIKRDTVVQRVIGAGYGNTFWKEQSPVLRQEKKARYGKNAVKKGLPKPFVQERAY
jgi:hypothetical protein